MGQIKSRGLNHRLFVVSIGISSGFIFAHTLKSSGIYHIIYKKVSKSCTYSQSVSYIYYYYYYYNRIKTTGT